VADLGAGPALVKVHRGDSPGGALNVHICATTVLDPIGARSHTAGLEMIRRDDLPLFGLDAAGGRVVLRPFGLGEHGKPKLPPPMMRLRINHPSKVVILDMF
jgi:hypothetical protein